MRVSVDARRAWPQWMMALLSCALLSGATPTQNRSPTGTVLLIELRDAIGPAVSDFFVRTLDSAPERNATLMVVTMDTPGGLDAAMRDMIRAILASAVPVAIYVAPSGARAASAGTYLLYASHIAAMAPATNLGAATPVNIGPAPKPAEPKGSETDPGDKDVPGDAMERKAVNDAVAYIRGLAELRGRNAEWAEAAVRTAASISASEALAQNVIDVIAKDVPDLLRQIDGRTVQVAGREITLRTQGLTMERIETDWRTQVLSVLTNPNVAYLLMLIGIYGLLLEGYNPGAVVPGIVGTICLLLALFAFQILSVNYAGLGLMAVGIVLIVAEAFVPSFGALGLGGIVAFVFGSILLLDSDIPGLNIARPLIAAVAVLGAAGMLALGLFFAKSRKRRVVTGKEQLIGSIGTAVTAFDKTGFVRVHGELWNAITSAPVDIAQEVRILSVNGLQLEVEPLLDMRAREQ